MPNLAQSPSSHNILGQEGQTLPALGHIDWVEFAQHHREEASQLLEVVEDHHLHLGQMIGRYTYLANLWPAHAPAYSGQAHRYTFTMAEVGGIVEQLRQGLKR